VDDHVETWPLRSQGFQRWLVWRCYKLTGATPSAQWLKNTRGLLTAIALYGGVVHTVYTRVGEHDGTIYIDLVNDRREVVSITAEGWQVVSVPPVRFHRPAGMAPLPRPEPGGSLQALCEFLNYRGETDLILMVSWILAALRPTGPYPILVLHGEQDSAKSTVTKVLRQLIDPHTTLLKRTIHGDRDLFITANNQWVLALDNLSSLPAWLSDALCTISTGGGYSTRKLYTDDEEINFNVIRPIVMNGIEDVATRGDFMDRAVVLSLPAMPDVRRRDERTFWPAFKAAQPRIFGALLDAVSAALRNAPHMQLHESPRMIDFVLWSGAAAPACAWTVATEQGEVTGAKAFMAAYSGNRKAANDRTLEASDVARAMLTLAERAGTWRGTATDLLTVLSTIVRNTRGDKWPKSAGALSHALHRLAPNLRRAGVHLEFARLPGGIARIITMRTKQEMLLHT
jgi:hypothetical protein